MQKLKFRALQAGAGDLLTRAQMKTIMGGDGGSGGSGGTCTVSVTCAGGSTVSCSSPNNDCTTLVDDAGNPIGVKCGSAPGMTC